MTKKKQNIIFTLGISFTLFVITYVFSLAKYFFWFDSKWIPNDFILIIFGGAFGSSLVVLLTEWFQYKKLKKNLEDELYNHMTILYSHLIVTRNTLKIVIENRNQQVSEGMLNDLKNIILIALNYFTNIDYAPFSKKQELYVNLLTTKNNYFKYKKLIDNLGYFDIAIIQTKLDEYKKNSLFNAQITSSFEYIFKVSKILFNDINFLIIECESLLEKIDYSQRYKWKENKDKIKNQDSLFIENGSLMKFLKDNAEKID